MTAGKVPTPPESRPDLGPVTWLTVDHPPIPAPGDLHLWLIRADRDQDGTRVLLDLLGERQRQRAARMTRAEIRVRYVRAQAELRRILAGYLDCEPVAVRFGYGPAGKPDLRPHRTDLELNLTTTGDIALVAVTRGEAVGIDCEQIRPRTDLDGIARRMFSPAEAQALAEAPERMRLERFHRAWTALEADCKCDGRGLLRRRVPGSRPPQIAHFSPMSGYVAAVASAELPPVQRWSTMALALD